MVDNQLPYFNARIKKKVDQEVHPNTNANTSDSAWSGAGDGGRTRDTKLGKLVLYQLSYTRSKHPVTWIILAQMSRGMSK